MSRTMVGGEEIIIEIIINLQTMITKGLQIYEQ
jgi:hypothetical protein